MERGSRDGMESVGNFRMGVTSGSMMPDAADRWPRRAELLSNWLLAEWHREQAQGELVIDGKRPSDVGGDIRGPDLN